MKLKLLITVLMVQFSTICLAQSEEEFQQFAHSGNVDMPNEVIRLPIEIWNDLILVKAKINGIEANFLWDNGFSISGIDHKLFQQTQLIPFGDQNNSVTLVDGNNAALHLTYYTAQLLELGSVKITDTPFLLFDSNTLTLSKVNRIEGVIGASVINKLNWLFNFDQHYVEISSRPFPLHKTEYQLNFEISPTNTHYMLIEFNGQTTYTQVDFGANTDKIEIQKSAASFFKDLKASQVIGQNSLSISGMAPTETNYTISDPYQWRIGGYDLNFTPILSLSNSTNGVLVGNKLFRDRFNIIINTTENLNYGLSKRTHPEPIQSEKSFGILVFNLEEEFKIIQLIPNDNLKRYPFQLMDSITKINDLTVSDFADTMALIAYQKKLIQENKPLKVELINGTTITIHPLDNYQFEYVNDHELWQKKEN